MEYVCDIAENLQTVPQSHKTYQLVGEPQHLHSLLPEASTEKPASVRCTHGCETHMNKLCITQNSIGM
jgi:hypothetical protein